MKGVLVFGIVLSVLYGTVQAQVDGKLLHNIFLPYNLACVAVTGRTFLYKRFFRVVDSFLDSKVQSHSY